METTQDTPKAANPLERRIDMTGCLVKELSFPKLDAKDGKKHMEMTITAVAEKVELHLVHASLPVQRPLDRG